MFTESVMPVTSHSNIYTISFILTWWSITTYRRLRLLKLERDSTQSPAWKQGQGEAFFLEWTSWSPPGPVSPPLKSGPSSCYLSTILRAIVNDRHNDDKRILNFLSHFIIRTALAYGKSDYPCAPFTKEKLWWKTRSDTPKVTQLGSGGAEEPCPDLHHHSTEGIHWEAGKAQKDSPQEVRFWELSPPLCSEGDSPRKDRRARWSTGQRRRQTEEAMVFRRQTAALGNAALCRPPLVAHSPFSHLKRNTGNFYLLSR